MTQITQAFAKHTQNEFPPKFVFWSENDGTLRNTNLTDIESLKYTHQYLGMSADYASINQKYPFSNIPVLQPIQ